MGDDRVMHCPQCGCEYEQWAIECVDCSWPLEPGAALPTTQPALQPPPRRVTGISTMDLAALDADGRAAVTLFLRGADVPHQWTGTVLSFPAAQRDVVDDALGWLDPQQIGPDGEMVSTLTGALPSARWQRIVAAMIDSLLLGVIGGLVHTAGAPLVAIGVMYAGYHIALTAMWGKTAGKAIVHCQVWAVDSSGPPSFVASAARWFVAQGALWIASLVASGLPQVARLMVGLLLTFVGMAVFAPIAWRRDRRGIHDLAAHTLVVDERSLWA